MNTIFHLNIFSTIGFSLLGSFITAFAFAASASGKLKFSNLTLPAVAQTTFIVAVICGFFLSPLMYWCLKGKNLLISLSVVYCLAFIVTVLLCFVHPRVGLYGAIIYWILILLIMKYYGPKV